MCKRIQSSNAWKGCVPLDFNCPVVFYCPQTERTEKHDRIKRTYDYENLLQRFQKMNDFKIRLEYARVLNDIAFLEKFLALNQLTEKEYFAQTSER